MSFVPDLGCFFVFFYLFFPCSLPFLWSKRHNQVMTGSPCLMFNGRGGLSNYRSDLLAVGSCHVLDM